MLEESDIVNNKGQALVEFVLVLPVIVLLIFGMIEIGNLIYQKYNLETYIDPAIELYKNEEEMVESFETKNNIDVSYKKEGSLVTVKITKNVKLITPGLMNFLDNPYEIETERVFYVGDGNE